MQQESHKRKYLVETILKMANEQDIDSLLKILVQGALEITNSQHGSVGRLNYHTGEIEIKHHFPDSFSPILVVEWDNGVIGKALQEKKAIYSQDWENMRSEIAIPIVRENIPFRVESEWTAASDPISSINIGSGCKVIGVLNIKNPNKDAFSATDEEVLSLLASYAAMRIEEIESSIKLAKLRQKEQEITDNAEDFDRVINIAINSVSEILGFDLVNISLVDLQKNTIESKYINCPDMSAAEKQKFKTEAVHSLDDKDIQAWLVRHGKIQVPTKDDSRLDSKIFKEFKHDRLVRVFVPMIEGVNNQVIGTLEAGYQRTYRKFIEERDIQILESFVNHTVQALERRKGRSIKRMEERLKCYPMVPIDRTKTITKPHLDRNVSDYLANNEVSDMIVVVEFKVPVNNELKQQILAAGGSIIRPLGNGRLVVSIENSHVLKRILEIGEVITASKYSPNTTEEIDRLDREAMAEIATPTRSGMSDQINRPDLPSNEPKSVSLLGILIAIFFNRDYRDRAANNLRQQQIQILEEPGDDLLVIDLTDRDDVRQAVHTIVNQIGLEAIEEHTVPTILSEPPTTNRSIDRITSLGKSLSLTGEGETIAIADTGIDTGDPSTIHRDLRTGVQQIISYPTARLYQYFVDDTDVIHDAADRYSGHGTHVAGCAIGTGEISIELGHAPIMGVAPGSKLIFQSLERTPQWKDTKYQDRYGTFGLFGIPQDLGTLFQFAYDRQARIHSNSWGDEREQSIGKYTRWCRSLDEFAWNNKEFLVVVAAGNNARQSESEPRWIDQPSVCPPGTAKNCLTVGACEHNLSPQFSDKTYGQRYPDRFSHEPFFSDGRADSDEHIAAFSSRGPCDDGRYKPDVIAPGTFVLSTRSSQIPATEFGSAPYTDAENHYMYMCGSSMATPTVAGYAALVRQYLREEANFSNPSAALLKAIIIHSAKYFKYLHCHNSSSQWVDNEQGWGRIDLVNSNEQGRGRIDLVNSLDPPQPTQIIFIDERKGMITGEKYEYLVKITDSSVPLKIILTYTDYPGTASTKSDDFEPKLVNNLNLILYSPDNKSYHVGNYFDLQHEIGPKWLDRTNNVEGIVVELPKMGTWRMVVIASEIQEEQQDFALVASGGGLELLGGKMYTKAK